MAISLRVPNLGESVVEGTVARWLVAVGDPVSLDQTLVELTTDKVDVEIPSPCAGIIQKILVAVDDTVEVGAELVLIDDAVADAPTPEAGMLTESDTERHRADSAGSANSSSTARSASSVSSIPSPTLSHNGPPATASIYRWSWALAVVVASRNKMSRCIQ